MMDKMEKAKAGMPQKTSIEISRMIVEEEWQGETGLLMPSSCFKCFSVICRSSSEKSFSVTNLK